MLKPWSLLQKSSSFDNNVYDRTVMTEEQVIVRLNKLPKVEFKENCIVMCKQ